MSKPTDGGRGVEWRSQRSMLRLFSWRHGAAHHRFRRHLAMARWTVLPRDFVLFGAATFRDEDDDCCIEVGVGVVRLGLTVAPWQRSMWFAHQVGGSRRTVLCDALGRATRRARSRGRRG